MASIKVATVATTITGHWLYTVAMALQMICFGQMNATMTPKQHIRSILVVIRRTAINIGVSQNFLPSSTLDYFFFKASHHVAAYRVITTDLSVSPEEQKAKNIPTHCRRAQGKKALQVDLGESFAISTVQPTSVPLIP
jgi:hypothetical protein